jgi:type IV secretory pathway VirB3-like protein
VPAGAASGDPTFPALTQATLVAGLIVSVTGFLSMVGSVALIIRRLRT